MKKTEKPSARLTDKQEHFCREYIIDFNATRAAIASGYSEKTAKDIGCQNLAKLYIQERIAELMQERLKRIEVTADNVVTELARIAMHDIRKLYDENGRLKSMIELDDDSAATISAFKTRKENQGNSDYDIIEEYRRYDKLKALELLGKHMGMFKDRIEHSGPDGKPIETKWTVEFIKANNGK